MCNYNEKPFQQLRRRSGESFSVETIRNWYIAREYILDLLPRLADEHLISPDSSNFMHFILTGDSDRMLAVARQLALSAHYISFREEDDNGRCANRTRITILSTDTEIPQRLQVEEHLCNLPKYCRFTHADGTIDNPDSYIDIEICISTEIPANQSAGEKRVILKSEQIDQHFDSLKEKNEFTIDTRMAFYTDQMYSIGVMVDNIPYENIHNPRRYTMALDIYQFEKLQFEPKPMFEENEKSQPWRSQWDVRQRLSNIFCSDVFPLRAKVINSLSKSNNHNGLDLDDTLWIKYNVELSVSEHARWVAEKLIMGYRPLTRTELLHDQNLAHRVGAAQLQRNFRNSLKKNDQDLAHCDICSYRELRRFNADHLKYDSFMFLAIPRILQHLK